MTEKFRIYTPLSRFSMAIAMNLWVYYRNSREIPGIGLISVKILESLERGFLQDKDLVRTLKDLPHTHDHFIGFDF